MCCVCACWVWVCVHMCLCGVYVGKCTPSSTKFTPSITKFTSSIELTEDEDDKAQEALAVVLCKVLEAASHHHKVIAMVHVMLQRSVVTCHLTPQRMIQGSTQLLMNPMKLQDLCRVLHLLGL